MSTLVVWLLLLLFIWAIESPVAAQESTLAILAAAPGKPVAPAPSVPPPVPVVPPPGKPVPPVPMVSPPAPVTPVPAVPPPGKPVPPVPAVSPPVPVPPVPAVPPPGKPVPPVPAVSPSGPVPAVSPPGKPVTPKKVRCRSPMYPACYNQWLSCPTECSQTCSVDCVACKPVCNCNIPGAVCQDPRFVGRDGVTFYFHGRKDQDFCLVSDPNLHINGHFIGKRNRKLTRDFTWVQSIGIMFDDHKLLVGAEKTSTWDDNEEHLSISFDDTPLSLDGKNWNYRNSSLIITRTNPSNGVAIEVQNSFRITATVIPIGGEESRIHGYNITDDDCFAHLDLGFKFFNLSDQVEGVLGQTYRRNYVSKIKVSANMPVVGDIQKYSTAGIFATDCTVSRFDRLSGTLLVINSGEVL